MLPTSIWQHIAKYSFCIFAKKKTIFNFSPNLTDKSAISCVLKPKNKIRIGWFVHAEHDGAVENEKNMIV